MTKTIDIDDGGQLTVVETQAAVIDGVPVTLHTGHSVSPGQLGAHLPQFDSLLTEEQRVKAAEIIGADTAGEGA